VRLNRDWIADHIPHRGTMCLLNEVLAWDTTHVRCRSSSHRAADNPLRAHGRLGIACGIEYAAQAMAVHAALAAGTPGPAPQAGYLASVRSVELYARSLDEFAMDLIISAARIAGDERTAMYAFSVTGGDRTALSGRATVVLNAAALVNPLVAPASR
jgi:predicted hotdog family 3-hydroxylacyl-ACP dehydratase